VNARLFAARFSAVDCFEGFYKLRLIGG